MGKIVNQRCRLQDYKTFFMLNSTKHAIYHAHKCKNDNQMKMTSPPETTGPNSK